MSVTLWEGIYRERLCDNRIKTENTMVARLSQRDFGPDFAQVYADFSSALKFADLPASAVAAARMNVYDTLACALAGFRAPGVQEVLEVVRDWGGKAECHVLWTDLRVPAPNAAWVNGIMAHACDYDDTHDKAILHGGISVVPAALAAAGIAGRPVSGEEFHTAVAAGLELICRLGVATRIGLIQAGFIYSALSLTSRRRLRPRGF